MQCERDEHDILSTERGVRVRDNGAEHRYGQLLPDDRLLQLLARRRTTLRSLSHYYLSHSVSDSDSDADSLLATLTRYSPPRCSSLPHILHSYKS